MTDTLIADWSSYQPTVDETYPYDSGIARANDGTYRDPNWLANLATFLRFIHTGRFAYWGTYFVWRENWKDTVFTFLAQIRAHGHRPHMFVVLDVESWRNQPGQQVGDHSYSITLTARMVFHALNRLRPLGTRHAMRYRDRRRILLYGNVGDLNELCPNRKWFRNIIVAAYGSNPSLDKEVLHQFSDTFPCPPFGTVDMNSADGLDIYQLAKKLGVTVSKAYKKKHPKRTIKRHAKGHRNAR